MPYSKHLRVEFIQPYRSVQNRLSVCHANRPCTEHVGTDSEIESIIHIQNHFYHLL